MISLISTRPLLDPHHHLDNREIYHSYLLPPGPTGLPLLGNLAMLDPGAPYETLASLVPKYGKVLGLEITW